MTSVTVGERSSTNAAWVRALQLTASIPGNPTRVFSAVIEELASERGDTPALLSDDGDLTFRGLHERAIRYARWALDHGLTNGETVCLLMPNCPEYMAIWLGVTSVGGIAALLNTNLTRASLAHCIRVVKPRHIIVAAELADSLMSASPHLDGSASIWLHGGSLKGFRRIEDEIDAHDDRPPAVSAARRPTIHDTALYIYTSGTTGLPKAARVSHFRVMQWSHWFAGMMNACSDDRMYNCLPMYHSVGGVVASGAVLVGGGSVVLGRKFSATRFWEDVIRWDCTLFQYIGELCRYLLYTDPGPHQVGHRIRMCCGNGLAPDIWERFAARFRIPRILEFYASTEGNLSLFNVEGRPGAVGRIPPFLRHRFQVALIKADAGHEAPLRDADGFCIRCGPGEVGEAIARISTDRPVTGFEGYTSEEASENKVLRDVFESGDSWFRTGDLMRKDDKGFFYFVDRIGDTFRWKGENVSTTEVSGVLCAFPGIVDAAVYGVAVPGADGRACMAALTTNGSIDLEAFRLHVVEHLPSYARPVFLRIGPVLETTSTFKHVKHTLARDGYDPASVPDPVFFSHPERLAFVPLDKTLHGLIHRGQIVF